MRKVIVMMCCLVLTGFFADRIMGQQREGLEHSPPAAASPEILPDVRSENIGRQYQEMGEAPMTYFEKTVYTCPMHPEITSEKSGKCPKCKMKLEKNMSLMTYACSEKDCNHQSAKTGMCPKHKKDLVKSEVKFHCPKCGGEIRPKKLKPEPVKPLKAEIPKEEKPVFRNVNDDEIGKEVICVVMNKKIKVTQKTKVVDYKGQKYYLCCPGCDSEFIKNPEKFVR